MSSIIFNIVSPQTKKFFLTFILIFGIICLKIGFNLFKQSNKWRVLLYVDWNLAVFLFCLIGCGIHCWKLGKMEGIEGTVQYFIDQGYIEVEEPDVE